jgi:FkbM family methyltransferase
MVSLVRNGRKLYRLLRTKYLLNRYPDGGYLKCGGVEVFCDFHDPTYAWYDGLSHNLAMDQKVIAGVLCQGQGNVLIDIGAHNGFFTAYLAKLAQKLLIPKAKVISLEPDRKHFYCLQKTAARCAQTNILLMPKGLSDKDTSLHLYRTRDNYSYTYAIEGAEMVDIVPSISLDTLASEYLSVDDRIVFIKVDIDGSEPVLFSGGKKTLEIHRPIIVMEFAPSQLLRAKVDARNFYSYLCDHFEVYWISYQGRKIKKVQRSDYKEMEAVVGDAITDLVLSKSCLDFSEVEKRLT